MRTELTPSVSAPSQGAQGRLAPAKVEPVPLPRRHLTAEQTVQREDSTVVRQPLEEGGVAVPELVTVHMGDCDARSFPFSLSERLAAAEPSTNTAAT